MVGGVSLAVTDIEIFKNGGAVTRATDSGYSLISDTGMYGDRVGLYRFQIQIYNTADDTGFFDAGSQYHVAIDSVTVDGKTVRFFPAVFEIGRQKVNVTEIDGDTGPADNLGRIAADTGTGSYLYRHRDTGGIADAIWAKDIRALTAFQFDTGVWGSNAARSLTVFAHDTGIWGSNVARTLTAFALDTGIAQTVWRSSTSGFTADTGSVAYAQGRIMAVRNDTGAAHLDQGRFGVLSDSGIQAAVLDTGKVASAIWTSHATRTLTAFALDTGIAQTVWRSSTSTFTADTGSVAYAQGRVMAVRTDTGAAHLDQGRFGVLSDSGVQAAVLDTGKVASAVWTSHATRALTAFALDTGIAQTVWRSSTSTFTGDTGSVAYAQGRLMAVRADTGAAHLDQGRLGVIADSGVLAAVLDTGKVASAVWTSHVTRGLTEFALDTGVADSVWKYTDTDARRVNVRAILDDTGAAAHLQQALALSDHILADVQKVDGDTGAATHLQQAAAANEHLLSDIERVDGDTGAGDVLGKFAESKLSSLGQVDTGTLAGTKAGTIDANVTYVNETQVQGTGAAGDEWRPV